MRYKKTDRFKKATDRKTSDARREAKEKDPRQRAFEQQTFSTGPNGPSTLRRQFYRKENE